MSLVHGDFHSGNAALVDDRIVIIDWSDAAIGNPLVDLVDLDRVERRSPMPSRRGDRRLGRRVVAVVPASTLCATASTTS